MLKPALLLMVFGVSGVCAITTADIARDAVRMCSIVPPPPDTGYDPTQLVRNAHVIVLARADSQSRTGRTDDGRTYSIVHLAVTEVIDAGAMDVPPTLRVPGSVTQASDFNPGRVAYHWVRPAGMRGSCTATTYQQGGEFLLLLRGATADSLYPYWAALSPTNEQVHGRDDPWVEWVRKTRHR